MRRYFLLFGTLMLTFVIGVYTNVLALRLAQFIPEVDPQSVPLVDYRPVECGRNKNGWWWNLQMKLQDAVENLPENPQGEPQILVITDDPEKALAELLKPKPTKSTKKR